MSMIANFLRVSRAELEEYLKDSDLLENRVYNEESNSEDSNPIDIDKSWEGILFLLTGQNFQTTHHPLARILFSGQIIDQEQDLGYGPAHFLTPEEVKDLNEKISKITTDNLRKKYDLKKMTELEIYPNNWEEENMSDYLIDYFEIVQEIFAEASKNNQAIITFLN